MCRSYVGRAGVDGKLYMALTNTDPHRPAHVVTNIPGRGHGTILTGPAMDTHNTFAAPDTIHPVTFDATAIDGKLTVDLPAKSVVVLAVH